MTAVPLRLTMTCGPYDRARALIEGSVSPRDIRLEIAVNADDASRQAGATRGDFDVAELYMGSYIADLPQRSLGLTALPVFVKRMFRHSYIYINRTGAVRRAADLDGRRVGIQNWFTTAALWTRGILADQYGVDLASITWVASRPELPQGWAAPSWLKLEAAPKDGSAIELLARGDVDASITTEVWAPGVHPAVDFLFPDYAEQERAFFRQTRCFPIMHVLAVRTLVLQRHPWVARSLFDAWEESKQRCYRWLEWQRVHMTSMWYRDLWERERELAGPDIYPSGFAKTRHEVDRLLRYAHEQGLTPLKYEPEELYWPSMLET